MKISLTMGLIFKIFRGSYSEPRNIFKKKKKKTLKMGTFFSEKSLKTWEPFLRKITPEHGYGSRAASGTPPTNPNLRTPLPPGATNLLKLHFSKEQLYGFKEASTIMI